MLVRCGLDLAAPCENPRMPRNVHVQDLRQKEEAVIQNEVAYDGDIVLFPYGFVELTKLVKG